MNDRSIAIGAPPGAGDAGAASAGLRSLLAGLTAALLRVPMFLKILLANVLIAAVAGGVALGLTAVAGRAPLDQRLGMALMLFIVGVLSLGTALNAVVVRLALSPLVALGRAAERVRRGDITARAPVSPLADRETRALVLLFNRMLDTLQAGRRRQRELARQVLEAEERERERISQELFAGPAQTLAGAMVRLRLAGRVRSSPMECDQSGCAESDDEVRDQIALALEEIRVLARRLRPPELGELGVRPALEAHARTLTEGGTIRVRVSGATPPHIEPDTATVLFRVLQEALTNAVIHSGGTCVDVTLATDRDRVVGEVRDDGKGFDVTRRLERHPTGLGITGMQERASYLGGSVTVTSPEAGGTHVRVELPLAGSPYADLTPPLASSAVSIDDSDASSRAKASVDIPT